MCLSFIDVISDITSSGDQEQDSDNGVLLDRESGDGSATSFSDTEATESMPTGIPNIAGRLDTPKLPDTVTVLDGPDNGKVYLVGTAHFSKESQQDVEYTIRQTQPNCVVLELCNSRLNILSLDEKTILEEAKNLDVSKMRVTLKEVI